MYGTRITYVIVVFTHFWPPNRPTFCGKSRFRRFFETIANPSLSCGRPALKILVHFLILSLSHHPSTPIQIWRWNKLRWIHYSIRLWTNDVVSRVNYDWKKGYTVDFLKIKPVSIDKYICVRVKFISLQSTTMSRIIWTCIGNIFITLSTFNIIRGDETFDTAAERSGSSRRILDMQALTPAPHSS